MGINSILRWQATLLLQLLKQRYPTSSSNYKIGNNDTQNAEDGHCDSTCNGSTDKFIAKFESLRGSGNNNQNNNNDKEGNGTAIDNTQLEEVEAVKELLINAVTESLHDGNKLTALQGCTSLADLFSSFLHCFNKDLLHAFLQTFSQFLQSFHWNSMFQPKIIGAALEAIQLLRVQLKNLAHDNSNYHFCTMIPK